MLVAGAVGEADGHGVSVKGCGVVGMSVTVDVGVPLLGETDGPTVDEGSGDGEGDHPPLGLAVVGLGDQPEGLGVCTPVGVMGPVGDGVYVSGIVVDSVPLVDGGLSEAVPPVGTTVTGDAVLDASVGGMDVVPIPLGVLDAYGENEPVDVANGPLVGVLVEARVVSDGESLVVGEVLATAVGVWGGDGVLDPEGTADGLDEFNTAVDVASTVFVTE